MNPTVAATVYFLSPAYLAYYVTTALFVLQRHILVQSLLIQLQLMYVTRAVAVYLKL